MRMALVIAVLAAIAVALVQVRRRQVAVGHEMQSLQDRHLALRRQLWDQQAAIGYLTAPRQVQGRMVEMAVARGEGEDRLSMRAQTQPAGARTR